MRRGQRRGREGRVDHRRAAAAALRVHLVVVRTAEDDVRRSGDVFRDVVFEIRADRDALVSALLDDAVLIEVAQAERSLEGRAAARDVHGVVGDHGRPEDFVLPVGVPHVGCDLLGREDRRLVVDAGLLVQIGHVFVAAQHVHLLVEGLDADAAVVAHPDFALLGALRRDDHHAVGSPRTVDGRRRGVFENLHRLDVRRVDHVDVARKSVDDPQGFVVALDRVGAADADLDGRSGLSVELVDLHARDTSLERLRHRDVGEFVDQVALDLGHGSREVAFALYAVADYDQFVHHETALREFDVECGAAVDRLFAVVHAEVGHQQRGVARDVAEADEAFGVGDFARVRAFHDDGGAGDGISVVVQDADRTGVVRIVRRLRAQALTAEQREANDEEPSGSGPCCTE